MVIDIVHDLPCDIFMTLSNYKINLLGNEMKNNSFKNIKVGNFLFKCQIKCFSWDIKSKLTIIQLFQSEKGYLSTCLSVRHHHTGNKIGKPGWETLPKPHYGNW